MPVRVCVPAACIAAMLSACPAGATPVPTSDTTAPVMVVLDASGSMATPDAPGRRIDAAGRAITSLVSGLPSTSRLGLEVFGAGTGSAPADKGAGCRDVHVVVPVGPIRTSAVASAVRSVRARGYTPIGAALRKAAAGLPKGPGSIVLVSDGIDTCAPPDPCAVAAQLKVADPDLVVHTIGFRAGAAARRQLACIARVTGGTYRSAADGGTLGPALRSQVNAGLRPYVVRGTPIEGSTSAVGAPLVSHGQYTDSFPRGSATTKYYSIDLAAPETVHISTTVVPPALRGGGGGARLRVVERLLNRSGDRCLSTEREDNPVLAGKVDPVTVVLSGVVGGTSWSKRCATRGPFVIQVTRDSTSVTPTSSETIISLEPSVSPVPSPTTVIPAALAPPPPSRATSTCTGGSSFNTAPLLRSGTCSDTLSTGETRYYRIHLDWGQRLSYRVVVDRVTGAGHGTGLLRSAVATPLRQSVTLTSASNASRDFGGPASTALTGATLVQVAYGNRDATRSDVRPYASAGDFYLSLGLSYPIAAVPYATRTQIAVDIAGRSQAGPRYGPLPSTTVRPEVSSSAPTRAAQTSAGPSSAAAEPSGGNSSRDTWLLAAGALLVGSTVVAGAARRRRTKHLDPTSRED